MAESKPEAAAQLEAAVREIRADLESAEGDASLREEANFLGRADALARLETGVLDRIDSLLDGGVATGGSRDALVALRARAEEAGARLEAVDEGLFRRLRSDIRRIGCVGREFREMLALYLGSVILGSGIVGGDGKRDFGYDSLDVFFNGLLHSGTMPGETRPREPGMVFFQKTPVRVVLEMVEAASMTAADTFYDLGSGMGQVAILVHLLSGAAARGIEVEPAYCEYARVCATELGLARVEILEADLRKEDYSEGTVFFMFTPCEGKMLEDVLVRLRSNAGKGARLFTYGPCTTEVGRLGWHGPDGLPGAGGNGLGEFFIA